MFTHSEVTTREFEYIIEKAMRSTFSEKAFFETWRSRPQVLFAIGPPGIGKTAIIEEAAKRVATSMGYHFVKYDDNLFLDIMENRDKYVVLVEIRLTECIPDDFVGYPRPFGDIESARNKLEEMVRKLENKLETITLSPSEKQEIKYRIEKLKAISKNLDEVVRYAPLGWVVSLATGPGVLFVDELTNETRSEIQSIAYKLLEGKVGQISFSPMVLIIAAGNPPPEVSEGTRSPATATGKALARKLPSPLLNRTIMYYVKPDLGEWIEWAKENNVPDYIINFVQAYPNFFISPVLHMTLTPFPSPRSWTNLGYTLKMLGIPDEKTLREYLQGVVVTSGEVTPGPECKHPDMAKVIIATVFGAVGYDAGLSFIITYAKSNAVSLFLEGNPESAANAINNKEQLLRFFTSEPIANKAVTSTPILGGSMGETNVFGAQLGTFNNIAFGKLGVSNDDAEAYGGKFGETVGRVIPKNGIRDKDRAAWIFAYILMGYLTYLYKGHPSNAEQLAFFGKGLFEKAKDVVYNM